MAEPGPGGSSGPGRTPHRQDRPPATVETPVEKGKGGGLCREGMKRKGGIVVIFDLETTGLRPERGDRIVEIGAVKLADSAIAKGPND